VSDTECVLLDVVDAKLFHVRLKLVNWLLILIVHRMPVIILLTHSHYSVQWNGDALVICLVCRLNYYYSAPVGEWSIAIS